MRLFVPTMEALLVEFDAAGRVRFENEEWMEPTVQERRAILHAARAELEYLEDLVNALENKS